MTPNLFKENVLQEEGDYSREKILKSAEIGLWNYRNYIDKSIQIVQQQGSIKIPIFKLKIDSGEIVWKVALEALSDKNVERAEKELFTNEIREVYAEKPLNKKAKKIKVIDRNAEENYLVLGLEQEEEKKIKEIYLKANDYQLRKQIAAINQLMYSPNEHQEPILQLFNRSDYAAQYFEQNIDDSIVKSTIDWKVLTDHTRDGTAQQRSFVYKALRTNDFALLEGPPGSGKTTAIIELIIQLIKQGKRVLLVSATHVAVDNVIHRILTTYKDQCEGKVVPLRIGDESNIRKDSVKPYRLQNFIKKKKREVKDRLGEKKNRTESQQKLYDYLKGSSKGSHDFDDIVLKSANLVGGTMIGVLKHPDIGNTMSNEMFDVMIVDESSKVTFLDFIVPALYAKKWILVGDVQQLSPYVEDDYVNESIDQVIKSKTEKEEIIHQFELRKDIKHCEGEVWGNYLKVLITKNINDPSFDDLGEVYKLENNFDPSPQNIFALNSASVVICMDSRAAKEHLGKHIFVKTKVFEGYIDVPEFKNRQKFLHHIKKPKSYDKFYHKFELVKDKTQEWKELVGSRIGQYYEYRFNEDLAKNIKDDLDLLIPTKEYWKAIDDIRKVALPSILELLQIGIGETKSKGGYAQRQLIYEGFEGHPEVQDLKFESLKYQHRMNDLIASTSRKHFYEDKNLITANTVNDRNNPLLNYKKEEADVIWVSNEDKTFRKRDKKGATKNINPIEKNDMKAELMDFIQFAQSNPKKDEDGKIEDYEVAVLTFYRQQEYELKQMLERLTSQRNKSRSFSVGNVKITLCTVDKFQGDEADLVLLSFAIFKKRAFYNNSNRLNVALTRARYKLVLFGNKSFLERNAMSTALQDLANRFEKRIINRNNNKR